MNPTYRLANILSKKVNNSSINFPILMEFYTNVYFLFNLHLYVSI